MKTYSTRQASEIFGAPSERWLVEQLRSGRFRGRKVGRHWRMTDEDIRDALDICGNYARRFAENPSPASGLTSTSRRKVLGI
jgi:hypothetical protein